MSSATAALRVLSATGTGELRVAEVVNEAVGVISIRLEAPAGTQLPHAAAGSHLEIRLPSGLVRHYSLCGDPEDTSSYTVAVLREERGRGGSEELHATDWTGRTLHVNAVRNNFPLEDHAKYLLIAGGIGVTPMMAMARELAKRDVEWQMLYLGRTRSGMAFTTELARVCGDRLDVRPDDEHLSLDLVQRIADTPAGTVIYCCGPEGLLKAVESACAAAHPARELRLERFAAGSDSVPATATDASEFTVCLKRQGVELQVPADRSILEVVRDVVPDVPFSCEQGYCGTCETFIVDGAADHRDDLLTPDQQAANTSMMICVSRSLSPRLELDL